MSISRYPHSAVITWYPEAVVSGGKIVAGSPVTINLICRFEPNAGMRYIQGRDGNMIYYRYKVFTPLFSTAGSQLEGSLITFGGQKFKILQCFPYQKNVEMLVS